MDYWEQRKAREMYEYMEEAEKVAAELQNIYAHASSVITKDMDRIFNRFMKRFKLTEDEAARILKVAGTDVNAVLRHMKNSVQTEGINEALAEIDAPAYRYRLNILEEKQRQIDAYMTNIKKIETNSVTDFFKKLAEKIYNHSMFDIQQMYGFGFSFTSFDKKAVDKLLKSNWSGANYSKRIWKNTDRLAESLKEELITSMLTGRSDSRTAQAIQEHMHVGAYEARRLVRTESCYISKEMEMASYDECGIDTYMYLATLDMRTSKVCRELDHKQFKVSEQQTGVNAPPMHPFCRSTIISGASAENLKEMKRRAFNYETGKTELVSGDMTYQEWYEKYVSNNSKAILAGKKVKNKTVDRKQWKLYKDTIGKIAGKSLDDFQEIKYNDIEKFEKMKRNFACFNAIERKNWSDEFKKKAKDTYKEFLEADIEMSAHALARFLDRSKKDGTPITIQSIIEHHKMPINYYDGKNNVRFYNKIAMIENSKTGEIVTILRRKNGKKDSWESARDG